MKRFITGEEDGRERFVDVKEFGDGDALVTGGTEIWGMWGQDESPTLPFRGDLQFDSTVFHPPPGCVRATLIRFGTELAEDPPDAEPNVIQDLMEGGGMHSTDTVDIAWMISGEIGLELDDGDVRWFREGDLLIQNGTRHKWHNRSGRPALVGWVVLGAKREDPPGEGGKGETQATS